MRKLHLPKIDQDGVYNWLQNRLQWISKQKLTQVPPPPVIQSMNVLENYERKNKTNGSPLPFRDQKVDSPYSELYISSTDTLENLVLHHDKRLNCIDPRVVWVEM